MKNSVSWINPKKITEIKFTYESESNLYDWYPEGIVEKKSLLWGLIKKNDRYTNKEGWGSTRFTDSEILEGLEYLKIDRSGSQPKLINKANVTVFLDEGHYINKYFMDNKSAFEWAEELATLGGFAQ